MQTRCLGLSCSLPGPPIRPTPSLPPFTPLILGVHPPTFVHAGPQGPPFDRASSLKGRRVLGPTGAHARLGRAAAGIQRGGGKSIATGNQHGVARARLPFQGPEEFVLI